MNTVIITLAITQAILGLLGMITLFRVFRLKAVKIQKCEICNENSFYAENELCLNCDTNKTKDIEILIEILNKKKTTKKILLFTFIALATCAFLSIFLKYNHI